MLKIVQDALHEEALVSVNAARATTGKAPLSRTEANADDIYKAKLSNMKLGHIIANRTITDTLRKIFDHITTDCVPKDEEYSETVFKEISVLQAIAQEAGQAEKYMKSLSDIQKVTKESSAMGFTQETLTKHLQDSLTKLSIMAQCLTIVNMEPLVREQVMEYWIADLTEPHNG